MDRNAPETRPPRETDTVRALRAAAAVVVIGVIVAIADARLHHAAEVVAPPAVAAPTAAPPTAPAGDVPSGYTLHANEPEEQPPTF